MPTTAEFARQIKQKYPAYANIPDEQLAARMLEKYPQYKSKIVEGPTPVSGNPNGVASAEQFAPKVDTVGQIASGVGAGVGKGPNTVDFVKRLGSGLADQAKGLMTAAFHPIDTAKAIPGAVVGMPGAIVDRVKQYGSDPLGTIYNDPAGFLEDTAGVVATAGPAMRGARAAAQGVGRAAGVAADVGLDAAKAVGSNIPIVGPSTKAAIQDFGARRAAKAAARGARAAEEAGANTYRHITNVPGAYGEPIVGPEPGQPRLPYAGPPSMESDIAAGLEKEMTARSPVLNDFEKVIERVDDAPVTAKPPTMTEDEIYQRALDKAVGENVAERQRRGIGTPPESMREGIYIPNPDEPGIDLSTEEVFGKPNAKFDTSYFNTDQAPYRGQRPMKVSELHPNQDVVSSGPVDYYASLDSEPPPIEVHVDKNGRKIIAEGHHRSAAALKKGRETLPAQYTADESYTNRLRYADPYTPDTPGSWHSEAEPGSVEAGQASRLHRDDYLMDQIYRQLLDDPRK